MDCVEFRKWQAMYMLEPFGEEWKQTARIEAAVMNAFGGKQGGGQFTWQERMPVPPQAEEPLTDDVVEGILRSTPMPRKRDGD